MDKKSAYYSIGFTLGFVVMILIVTLANQLGLVLNWDTTIVFSLILILFIYILKRKYVDEYTLKSSEKDFQIIYGEMIVNYADAAKALENCNFTFENCEVGLSEVQEVKKEFIFLKPETNYFYIKEAIEYGKKLGYKESSWYDLYALSKVNDKETSVFNVVETLNIAKTDSQGTMVAFMNTYKKFRLTFLNSHHQDDFVVLMVRDKEE